MTDTLDNLSLVADDQTPAESLLEKELPEVTTESIVESILFSTDAPLSAGRIAQLLGIGDVNDVKKHIETLNARYERNGSSFRIQSIAKGYQMLTLPVYNNWVQKLHKTRHDAKLSSAALETLAIIAYKQPILRVNIESIRGVAAGDMLVRLREMNLVRIVGRAEEIGRPLLYGTTNRFLKVFGLSSLKDLPKLDDDRPDEVPPLRMAGPAPSSNNDTRASHPASDQTRDRQVTAEKRTDEPFLY